MSRYLTRHNALERFDHIGKSCQWRDSNYRTVMIVIYRGRTDYECFIPETEDLNDL
jgi:hypothetical protein